MDKRFKARKRIRCARPVWNDVLQEGLTAGLHRIDQMMRTNTLRSRTDCRGNPWDDGAGRSVKLA
jgi:putative transposase